MSQFEVTAFGLKSVLHCLELLYINILEAPILMSYETIVLGANPFYIASNCFI